MGEGGEGRGATMDMTAKLSSLSSIQGARKTLQTLRALCDDPDAPVVIPLAATTAGDNELCEDTGARCADLGYARDIST